MKKLRRKAPVLVSVLLAALFVGMSYLAAVPLVLLFPGLVERDMYLAQLLAECLTLLVFLGITWALGMGFVLRKSRRPLQKRLIPCLPIVVLYTYSMVSAVVLCWIDGVPLRGPVGILIFALCMLSIGATEELVFRGLITRMLFIKYGKKPAGVWLTVLLSSLLFGLMHLTNAVGGGIDLGSILIQVVGAMALGVCLAAIYLRTGSLWTVALLHGYMDFCALISTGVFNDGTLVDALGGYSLANLVSVVLYGGIGAFLLRPSKMKHITDPEGTPSNGEIMGLMVVVLLMSGMVSAVTVLSI